jgi:uncharacterized phage-associated protein
MKLQKLVYFAHGWHLAYSGQPLIPEEIEAWNYGPVIETLYRELKSYGSGEITAPIEEIDFHDNTFISRAPTVEAPPLRQFLGNVVGVYGKFSPIQLSNMTHAFGTPWQRLKAEFPHTRSLTIPNELIRDYFVTQLPKPS